MHSFPHCSLLLPKITAWCSESSPSPYRQALKAALQLGLRPMHKQLLGPSLSQRLCNTSLHSSLHLVRGQMCSAGQIRYHFLGCVWIALLCSSYLPHASALLTSGAAAPLQFNINCVFSNAAARTLGWSPSPECEMGSRGEGRESPAHSTPVSPF